MIPLIALMAVYENLEPRAGEVSIQALVRVPELGEVDARALEILADVLPRSIEGYSNRDILTVTSGVPVRCAAEPDHLRITLSVAPSNLKSGLSLLTALLKRSQISDAAVTEAVRSHRENSYWGAALRPIETDVSQVRGSEVQSLYQRLVTPASVELAIGGAVVPGEAQEAWEKLTTDWPTPPPDRANPYLSKTKYRAANPSGISTLEIAGKPFSSRDAAFPIRFLAVVALGSGKGSALFRVARQTMEISYRQEAVLTPVPQGFSPRLVLAFSPRADEATLGDSVRKALSDDIAKWDDAELKRAVGMAETVLLRNTELSPLSLLRSGPVPDNLEGRTFLKAYWPMKTGQPWNPNLLVGSTRLVRLEELKEAALDIVTAGEIRLQTGRP